VDDPASNLWFQRPYRQNIQNKELAALAGLQVIGSVLTGPRPSIAEKAISTCDSTFFVLNSDPGAMG
jgi:hypothetical protein